LLSQNKGVNVVNGLNRPEMTLTEGMKAALEYWKEHPISKQSMLLDPIFFDSKSEFEKFIYEETLKADSLEKKKNIEKTVHINNLFHFNFDWTPKYTENENIKKQISAQDLEVFNFGFNKNSTQKQYIEVACAGIAKFFLKDEIQSDQPTPRL
jgi:hypothetical protein